MRKALIQCDIYERIGVSHKYSKALSTVGAHLSRIYKLNTYSAFSP